MIIPDFKPFGGQHCETTATGTLLKQLGIELSEPMLFGLGEGLGFIYWKMKTMDFPFLGGRIKPDLLTRNIAQNLHLDLIVQETSSKQKAWEQVKALVDNGQAVGLKLDCFYLQYFTQPVHFAGHYVALYGYDHENAYLVDTRQQGGLVKTSLESLALARAAKGPMASKNLFYILRKTAKNQDINTSIVSAIRNNANEYLNPPITNIGFKGILKTSSEIVKWFQTSKNVAAEFSNLASIMERGGTGGALFRNLYRDFLRESYELLQLDQLNAAYGQFAEIASLWTLVAQLFEQVSCTKDIKFVHQASGLLKTLAEKEKKVMELLSTI
jgi:hypothetical protein